MMIWLFVMYFIGLGAGIILTIFILKWVKQKSSKRIFNLHKLVFHISDQIDKKGNLTKLLKNHHTLLQYIEFGLVGALGVGVNALVYFPLVSVVGHGLSWLLGILVAFTFNFLLDKYLVFES